MDVKEGLKVSVPKNKEDAPAEESKGRKPKRNREQLIRLDDLIPKKDVRGGRQWLFGAAYAQQPTQIEKEYSMDKDKETEQTEEKKLRDLTPVKDAKGGLGKGPQGIRDDDPSKPANQPNPSKPGPVSVLKPASSSLN